jgi:hypothetical protein
MPEAFSPTLLRDLDSITLGLGRGAAIVLFAYTFLKLQALVASARFELLLTGWGAWYLLEVLGLVALPCAVLATGCHTANVRRVRWGAALALVGIVLNRMNVSVIALNWNAAERYVPSLQEWLVSLALLAVAVTAFRWVAVRMPVFRDDPALGPAH